MKSDPILYSLDDAMDKVAPGECVVAWGTTGYYILLSKEKAIAAGKIINTRIVYERGLN